MGKLGRFGGSRPDFLPGDLTARLALPEYGESENRKPHGTVQAFYGGMRNTLLILLLAALPHFANAQETFGGFDSGFGSSFGGGISWSHRVVHAPGTYDPRVTASCLKAAKIAENRAEKHSVLLCWQYVKTALLASGAVHSYPTSLYAKQAGSELTSRHGFVRLHTRNPYSAPIGAVIVYGGYGAGHVEMRTARGFVSDYRSTHACRYPVIGVYAKLSS
jgi:hypothetical protein